MSPNRDIVIANFNIHAGIDGWGVPFDVLYGAKEIDADILVLCEAWQSDENIRQSAHARANRSHH